MADTFGKAWNSVRLHCSTLPPLLARDMTLQAFREIAGRRSWSYLRGESEFLIDTAKTGTVDVTRGSATVVGSGGADGIAFAASDEGRQFRVGSNEPVYTIESVDTTGDTSAVLTRVYGGSTATDEDATVLDAYLTAPADFARWIAVLDTENNWQLRVWITLDELNLWDAQRSATGTPWAVVDRTLASNTSYEGRAQFELWPYALSQKNYPYFYFKQQTDPADDDTLRGPLANRSELLVNLALALVAEWPGTEERKNPYFNLTLARMKRDETSRLLDRLEVIDEEMYMTWLETVSLQQWPFAPGDSRYLQNHDVIGGYGAAYGY